MSFADDADKKLTIMFPPNPAAADDNEKQNVERPFRVPISLSSASVMGYAFTLRLPYLSSKELPPDALMARGSAEPPALLVCGNGVGRFEDVLLSLEVGFEPAADSAHILASLTAGGRPIFSRLRMDLAIASGRRGPSTYFLRYFGFYWGKKLLENFHKGYSVLNRQ